MPTANQRIAAIYAGAFRASLKKTDAELVVETLIDMLTVIIESDAWNYLKNPLVPEEGKITLIGNFTTRLNAHPNINRLFQILIRKKRTAIFAALKEELARELQLIRNIREAEVRTAVPCDENTRQRIMARFKDGTGKKTRFTFMEDPALTAGFRVRIGNTEYDGALTRTLENLAKRLRKTWPSAQKEDS